MKGIGFKVLCKEEMEVYKELPKGRKCEVVLFNPDIFYLAINEGSTIAVIDRNSRNIKLDFDLFNRHFKIV